MKTGGGQLPKLAEQFKNILTLQGGCADLQEDTVEGFDDPASS